MNKFEPYHKPLASLNTFLSRLGKSVLIGFSLLLLFLCIGIFGYWYFESMNFIDAFANASMILSGMGPLEPLKTNGGKLFAGFYALLSGIGFLIVAGVIFAPLFHRFLHKFHMQEEKNSK